GRFNLLLFGDPFDFPMLQNPERVSKSTPKDVARILLVDIDSQMRQHVTQLLAANYGIDAAADAPTASSLARERTPDLVLASVMTWKPDGVDIVREFRRNAQLRVVPIILYSTEEELCMEGVEAGANDYLLTPFSERQLLTRIRAQLRVAQMHDESIHALRASEERYRTLANAVNTGVWSAAPNGDVVGEVYGWEKMTGQTPEQYRGFRWMDVVHPDDRQQLLKNWQQ